MSPDKVGDRSGRLLSSQQGGLLLQEFFDGFLGHDAGRIFGELLDLVGIEVEIGADVLLDPACDDFSPPLGHTSDPVESIEDDLRKGIGCPSLDFG